MAFCVIFCKSIRVFGVMDEGHRKEYFEQFCVNFFGISTILLISYVLYIFKPYVGPIVLASFFSIPLAGLKADFEDFIAKSTSKKMHHWLNANFFLSIATLLSITTQIYGWRSCCIIVVTLGVLFKLNVSQRIFRMILFSTLIFFSITAFLVLQKEMLGFLERMAVIKGQVQDFSFINSVFEILDDACIRFFGCDILKLSDDILSSLGIDKPQITAVGQNTKVLQLFHSLNQLLDFSLLSTQILRIQEFITSKHALMVAGVVFSITRRLLILFFESAEFVVQVITFFSFCWFLLSKKRKILAYAAETFGWIEGVEFLVEELDYSLTVIFKDLIQKFWLEFAGTYTLSQLFGSNFGFTWGILAGVMALLPMVPHVIVTCLIALELYLKNHKIWCICFIAAHWILNGYFVPKVKIPHCNDTGILCCKILTVLGYFADLSVIVGVYTFGVKGFLLGPMLGSLPIIAYRFLLSKNLIKNL